MHQRYPDKVHGKQKDRISTEMYLKTIYQLKERNKEDPRPIDIVHNLELSKSSVSEMLGKLAREGYIKYESYGKVTLTDKGLKMAESVVKKFKIIEQFLKNVLKIPSDKVYDEACNLEHAFSDYAIEKLEDVLKCMKDKKCKFG